jgi:hypothetical protein
MQAIFEQEAPQSKTAQHLVRERRKNKKFGTLWNTLC